MSVSPFLAALSEAEFQQMIVDRAKAMGWLVHHDRGDYSECIAGDPGFPDLVLAQAGTVLFIECKSMEGRTTPSQDAWLNALAEGGHHFVYVARPSDWTHIQKLIDTKGKPS